MCWQSQNLICTFCLQYVCFIFRSERNCWSCQKKRRKLTTKTTLITKKNAHTHANQNHWNYSPTGKIEKCSGVTTTYVLMYIVHSCCYCLTGKLAFCWFSCLHLWKWIIKNEKETKMRKSETWIKWRTQLPHNAHSAHKKKKQIRELESVIYFIMPKRNAFR